MRFPHHFIPVSLSTAIAACGHVIAGFRPKRHSHFCIDLLEHLVNEISGAPLTPHMK